MSLRIKGRTVTFTNLRTRGTRKIETKIKGRGRV